MIIRYFDPWGYLVTKVEARKLKWRPPHAFKVKYGDSSH